MRLLIVSNRLPVAVNLKNGKLAVHRGFGGMALGLETYLSNLAGKEVSDYAWIGWPGVEIPQNKIPEAKSKLASQKLIPVCLSARQIENFYNGFSNDTLWPMFHSFPGLVNYSQEQWNSYKEVNELYSEAVAENYRPGDIIWIHDYHLMLVPKIVREKLGRGAPIGFFLHIPFPTFEIYRLMPEKWRRALLQGLLGADLVGFHTYDYAHYFNNSVQRILGYESNRGLIFTENSSTKVDTFPMGIDFEKFNRAPLLPDVQKERQEFKQIVGRMKVILSIDRLDYTKGIIKRLSAYAQFLEKSKDWHGKILLMMVVVPSRTEVPAYQEMKSQIDELVGKINGKFSTLHWVPIIYQFKSLNFEQIVAMYSISDVALVTPLRDGMNLVAKEYVAARRDMTGVLILSEMAGSAAELGEAIIINPYHEEAIVEALDKALTLPVTEQKMANAFMQDRLRRYNITRWAEDFISTLNAFKKSAEQNEEVKLLTGIQRAKIIKDFKSAVSRLLLLDYDGTLVPYASRPGLAKPPADLIETLKRLAGLPNVTLCLISGRDKAILGSWFKKIPINFVAEHGMWIKEHGKSWQKSQNIKNDWKEAVLPILAISADRLPGAFVEEKDYSLVWHYRLANPWQAQLRVKELTAQLSSITANLNVQVTQGQKIIEVRTVGVTKGTAAAHFMEQKKYDFILAAGDDSSDEDMFKSLPASAFTIKVGQPSPAAKFIVDNPDKMTALLKRMIEN